MADIQHVDILDPNIHEPKGVADASSGQVYVANGAGSGNWTTINAPSSRVVVNAITDFPTAVSGVITLAADTEYLVATNLSTSNRLILSDGTFLHGIDSSISGITYTGSGIMITSTDSSNKVSGLSVGCASGTLFNISATGPGAVFQFVDCTVTSCNSIGTIDTITATQFTDVAFNSITTSGISFVGSLALFVTTRCLFTIQAGTLFGLGSATFSEGFVQTTSFVTLNGSSIMLSGLASSGNIGSDGLGSVSNTRISGTGTTLSTISVDDARWQFYLNDNIQDSRVDGLLSLPNSGGTYTTTISAANTPVVVNGTHIIEETSQMTGTAAGRLTYDGVKDVKLPITASFSLEPAAGTNKNLGLYIGKNGSVIANSKRSVTVNNGSKKSVTLVWQDLASSGDYYEVFLENNTDTTDIVVFEGVFRIN